jgi:hypothetical protein
MKWPPHPYPQSAGCPYESVYAVWPHSTKYISYHEGPERARTPHVYLALPHTVWNILRSHAVSRALPFHPSFYLTSCFFPFLFEGGCRAAIACVLSRKMHLIKEAHFQNMVIMSTVGIEFILHINLTSQNLSSSWIAASRC